MLSKSKQILHIDAAHREIKWYWEMYLANKVAHSGNKPASTVVPMVSYGMSMSNENQNVLKELVKYNLIIQPKWFSLKVLSFVHLIKKSITSSTSQLHNVIIDWVWVI
jgi:hypothetical protein